MYSEVGIRYLYSLRIIGKSVESLEKFLIEEVYGAVFFVKEENNRL